MPNSQKEKYFFHLCRLEYCTKDAALVLSVGCRLPSSDCNSAVPSWDCRHASLVYWSQPTQLWTRQLLPEVIWFLTYLSKPIIGLDICERKKLNSNWFSYNLSNHIYCIYTKKCHCMYILILPLKIAFVKNCHYTPDQKSSFEATK